MQLNEEAKKRIKTSKIAPDVISDTFESMLAQCEVLGSEKAEVKMDYNREGMVIEPGDMVPYIILGLRSVPTEIVEAEVSDGS